MSLLMEIPVIFCRKYHYTYSKGFGMCDDIETTTINLAEYILNTKSTIRGTAQKFEMAKSTVHYYLKYKLKEINVDLYFKVKKIMTHNFNEKHIRGGMATRQKYLNNKLVENYE